MSKSDHSSILKTSFLTGGAQLASMICGFLRMKFAALFLGVAGVGVLSMYTQAIGLILAVAGMGLVNSGIREIAAADGKGDVHSLVGVFKSLRVMTFATGLLASGLTFIFSEEICILILGSSEDVICIRLLALAILLSELASSQLAVLRGLGKVRVLALQNIAVALGSVAVAYFSYKFAGKIGAVIPIVFLYGASLVLSLKSVSSLGFPKVSLSARLIISTWYKLVRMGGAFVFSSVITMGSVWFVSIMIQRELGLGANGLFQSAFSVSVVCVSFIFVAMGQDYYPKLTKVINLKHEAVQLVNRQAEVAVVLALPCLVTVGGLAPLVLRLMFSPEFIPGAFVLSLLCLACMLKVLSWPLLQILVARGDYFSFGFVEFFTAILQSALGYFGLKFFGLKGVALAFVLSGVCIYLVCLVFAWRKIDFRYSYSMCLLIPVALFLQSLTCFVGSTFGAFLAVFSCLFSIFFLVSFMKSSFEGNKFVSRVLSCFK